MCSIHTSIDTKNEKTSPNQAGPAPKLPLHSKMEKIAADLALTAASIFRFLGLRRKQGPLFSACTRVRLCFGKVVQLPEFMRGGSSAHPAVVSEKLDRFGISSFQNFVGSSRIYHRLRLCYVTLQTLYFSELW